MNSLVLLIAALMAAPPKSPRRDAEPDVRPARRDTEASPPGPTLPLDVEEQPLWMSLDDRLPSCTSTRWSRVRERLLALHNDSQVMSLEIWGDQEVYHVGDHVLFHMRAPRAVYVTLWWLGPEGHTVVAMDNAHIPAERNVTVDTGGVVVPPLGKEQWVALATLEPIPIGCRSELAMLANIERRITIEHGVGRWDVVSAP